MFNLGTVSGLLNAANPFSWLQTIYQWIGIATVFTVFGFYAGCEYKQNEWDASKFKALEQNKKLEKKDIVEGAKAVGEIKQTESQITANTKAVKQEISSKPLIKVIGQQVQDCPVSEVKVITKEGTNEITPGVYLTAHFQRLHDLSARPRDAELRARTYAEEHAVEINEGFALIAENYDICTKDQARLDALIDRILQKQKTFKE